MNSIGFEDLLQVRKPARYTGGEYNQIKKEWSPDIVKFCLAFPDVYEIGMSHLGSRIIYHILNGLDYAACERVFAPWVDMEDILRKKNIPLFSLESRKPLKEFDILGFSLGYELNYTNVLNMLDLAGIEIWSERRRDGPVVIAGGIGAFFPETMAPFIDLFVVGDGEEAIVEIADALRELKLKKMKREEILLALCRIKGTYAPAFYKDTYFENGTLKEIARLRNDAPPRIKKRVVRDLNDLSYPVNMVVPYVEAVHDRYVLEIMRGCTRGCRFCQAGFLYRPVRERKVERLLELAGEGIKKTGYEEVSLVSLSSGDYSALPALLKSLDLPMTSISLSSLHIDNITPEILSHLKAIKRNSFTFAPETAEMRLSCAINKKFDYVQFLGVVKNVFEMGYQKIKLYFIIGLPGEKDSILENIYNLVMQIAELKPLSSRRIDISLSVSNFIPKPHTPFQWEKMEGLDSLRTKQIMLKKSFKRAKGLKFNYHDLNTSFLEAVLSRGDRRLSSVIYEAWRTGAKFDSWREGFRYLLWEDAFKKTGIDPYFYSHRERGGDELFPWDHIDTGIHKNFLAAERDNAKQGIETPDCRNVCLNCGLCPEFEVKNILTYSSLVW